MSVYSARFFSGQATLKVPLSYVVPPNRVAVVRQVTAYLSASGATTVHVSGGGAYVVQLVVDSTKPPGAANQWVGRYVLYAGETLQAAVLPSVSCYVYAGGYLLSAGA